MKIKKGDNVKILIGKDKGKKGKVLQVLIDKDMVVVEGLNLHYKHLRPRRERESGQRVMFPAPINVSNVILICPKCGKATRVKYRVLDKRTELKKEKKQRVCKKCKQVLL